MTCLVMAVNIVALYALWTELVQCDTLILPTLPKPACQEAKTPEFLSEVNVCNPQLSWVGRRGEERVSSTPKPSTWVQCCTKTESKNSGPHAEEREEREREIREKRERKKRE